MNRNCKFAYFIVLLFLCTSLTVACSQKSADDDNDRFPITIMANLHTAEIPPEKIERILEEKTGTELDIQWVFDGTYEEKLKTAFATGTLPQVTFLKNQGSFAMFKDAIRNDQFWEVGPYLDQFENLGRLKQEVLNNTSVDGKIYSLYQGRPLSRQGIIYRKDWADQLGLSAPHTTADLFEMMKQFTENDPDFNGIDDTIGLTDRNDLVYGAFKTVSSYFGTPNNWGVQNQKLLPEFMFPEYMDTMNYFREIYQNGYMNQDFPVTSKTNQQRYFKNGTAGLYIGSMGDVLSIYLDAVQLNPDVEFEVVNRITDPGGTEGIWSIPGYGTVVLFPKSAITDEAQLLKVLSFFDQLMTDEISNLIYWGIEGEHYKVSGDGQADASIIDNTISEREVKPYQALEIGEPETNGRYEGNFNYDVKDKADQLARDNEKFLVHDPTAPLDSKTNNEVGLGLQNIIDDATYLYILGDIDESGFQNAIDQWKKQGGNQIIEEFNASWQVQSP